MDGTDVGLLTEMDLENRVCRHGTGRHVECKDLSSLFFVLIKVVVYDILRTVRDWFTTEVLR